MIVGKWKLRSAYWWKSETQEVIPLEVVPEGIVLLDGRLYRYPGLSMVPPIWERCMLLFFVLSGHDTYMHSECETPPTSLHII